MDFPGSEELTPAQRDALTAAYRLLGEHFDASVIGVVAQVEDESSVELVGYSGGHATALGLAQMVKARIAAE